MKRTFIVTNDAGHGWAKVDFGTLIKLGMDCSDFSSFSFLYWQPRKGKFADFILLEEDCDLTKFIARYVEVTGRRPKFSERHVERSAVRTSRLYYRNDPALVIAA